MNIIKTNILTGRQFSAIKELEALCRSTDNLTGSLFLSPELNYDESLPCFLLLYEGDSLNAFLSIFMPSEYEAQISVCTHPDKRRRGLCTRLLCEAADILEEYDIYDMIFLTEPGKTAFEALLKKLDGKLISSEYLMTYDIRTASCSTNVVANSTITATHYKLVPSVTENLDTLIDIHHRAFSTDYEESAAFVRELFDDKYIKAYSFFDEAAAKIIGSCYMDISSSQLLIILGVCIAPEMQHKGLGMLMMSTLIKNYALQYNKPITLQVSSNNASAKRLYERLGFTITSQFNYHVVDCENIY